MAATIPTNGIVLNSGLNVADGDVVLASGHGISFSATSDSADTMVSELFDDYETGYFTPALSSTGASWTYYSQKGVYTKIGRTVHYHVQIITNSKSGGTNSNTVSISNLPFTSLNHSSNPVPSQAIGFTYNWQDNSELGAPGNVPLRALVGADSDTIALYDANGSGILYEDARDGSAANYIYVGGHYIAA
jgi:hypothetical protein